MKNQWHIYNEQIESVKSLPSKVEQSLEIAGIIYAAYQKQCQIDLGESDETFVVVGGLSVEFYTQGNYMTEDIDIILSHDTIFSKVMGKLSFQKEDSRNWYRNDLLVSVETPSGPFAGNYDMINHWQTQNTYRLPITSVEDIFADRVRSIVYSNTDDIEWLVKLWNTYTLDTEYLINQACETKEEKSFVKDFMQYMNQETDSITNYPSKTRYLSLDEDDLSIDDNAYNVSQYIELTDSILTPPDKYSLNEGNYAGLIGKINNDIIEFRTSDHKFYKGESETGFKVEDIYKINQEKISYEAFRDYLNALK